MRNWNILLNFKRQYIKQHKRFVPYSTHPNFCFAKTSFMLGTLGETVDLSKTKTLEIVI